MLGISATYYDTLKFLHVVAAIVWVGGGIYAQGVGDQGAEGGRPCSPGDHRDGHR